MSTAIRDPFPRWRKPRPTDHPDDWPDGCSAVRARPRELTPEQQEYVDAVVALIDEDPMPGIGRKFTSHRKIYARCFLVDLMMGEGCSATGRRLGISAMRAWRGIRRGPEILRSRFSPEEVREILAGPPPSPPSSRPPPATP